jgi:hypothetical protein
MCAHVRFVLSLDACWSGSWSTPGRCGHKRAGVFFSLYSVFVVSSGVGTSFGVLV